MHKSISTNSCRQENITVSVTMGVYIQKKTRAALLWVSQSLSGSWKSEVVWSWKDSQESKWTFLHCSNTVVKVYVSLVGVGLWLTRPSVCLISQQPDTGERGEMERGQRRPHGTFKMPLWGDVRQELLSAQLTKPETCTDVVWEEGG